MCFSATASFVTAGIVTAVGAAALCRVKDARDLPLAATPVLFGVQQSIEGWLWLNLPVAPDSSTSAGLTLLYLLFAEVFWPVYAPIAVWLVEPSERRRQLVVVCLAVGVAVGAYLLWPLLTRPHGAAILHGHIVYVTGSRQPDSVGLAYLAATGLPLILSSQRTLVALGAVILYHFEQSRRLSASLAVSRRGD